MKTGLKTTEFLMTFVVAVLTGLAGAFAEKQWAQIAGIVASAITAAWYTKSRSDVKRTAIVTKAQK